MPELSILLPSLRPAQVEKCIAAFAATNAQVDYELIIVSPFAVSGEKVVHLPETERRGVLYAMNEAYKIARGEYIALWSDDAEPQENCLSEILAFTKAQPKDELFLAGFAKRDPRGDGFGQWQVYGRLYVGWLCASKRTIDAVGGLFDPAFKNYWGDPDLSMRVWDRGGRVAVCKTAYISVGQLNDEIKATNLSTCFEKDTETFFNKWHDTYGNGRKKIWWRLNTEIPNSLDGHLRAFLRTIPYLKEFKDLVIAVARPTSQRN